MEGRTGVGDGGGVWGGGVAGAIGSEGLGPIWIVG
jgi:hypothetical protein